MHRGIISKSDTQHRAPPSNSTVILIIALHPHLDERGSDGGRRGGRHACEVAAAEVAVQRLHLLPGHGGGKEAGGAQVAGHQRAARQQQQLGAGAGGGLCAADQLRGAAAVLKERHRL